MTVFAPGFIDVVSRSLGSGTASLSIAHIVAVSPTHVRGGDADTEQCTVLMDSGDSVVLFQSREDVLQAIAEAAGASPIGTGVLIDKISASVAANTQALVAAARNAAVTE